MRRDVTLFQHRLAATLRAGIPVTQAVGIARDGVGGKLGEALAEAERRVRGGGALAPALRARPGVFREVEIAIVEVGEETGLLPENLERLAAWNERESAGLRKLALGLLYPAILLVLAIFIPKLPILVTRSAGAYVAAVSKTALPLAAILAVGAGAALFLRGQVPALWSRVKNAVPVIGPNLRKLAIARYGESLSILYASGVHLPRALRLAGRSFGDVEMERRCRKIPDMVERGATLEEAFGASGVFPQGLVGAVGVGERTGDLDRALDAFARLSREEAETAIRALLIALPLAVYLLVAAYIAYIVISFFGGYFRTLGSI